MSVVFEYERGLLLIWLSIPESANLPVDALLSCSATNLIYHILVTYVKDAFVPWRTHAEKVCRRLWGSVKWRVLRYNFQDLIILLWNLTAWMIEQEWPTWICIEKFWIGQVRMVTGDNAYTAKAIAQECGIFEADGIVVEGPVFRTWSEHQLDTDLDKLCVSSRIYYSLNENLVVTSYLFYRCLRTILCLGSNIWLKQNNTMELPVVYFNDLYCWWLDVSDW